MSFQNSRKINHIARCMSFSLILLTMTTGMAISQIPAGYAGKPWHDSIQVLPGILQPERYDDGVTGMTWFDTDAHIGSYLAHNSAVDLDAVKATDQAVPNSTVKPTAGNIYWGWLENNEWLKMTVDVKQAGTYTISGMVGTAMVNTSFKVDALQGSDSVSSGELVMPFAGPCPLECYHYWNFAKNLGEIKLKAGLQVIRMQIVKKGYNIDYLSLELATASSLRERAHARRNAFLKPSSPRWGSRFDTLGKRKKPE
jgi:hypothetical protein